MPGYKPTEITLVQGTVQPNGVLTFRVRLESISSGSMTLTITTDQTSAFPSLPMTVALPPGVTEFPVQLILGPTPPANWIVYASASDTTVKYAHPPAND